MTLWEWFSVFLLPNIFFWWFALIVLFSAGYPVVHAFRLWQAKHRFIRSQGARLENPQNADVRFQLATLYAEGGVWRRALPYAEEAVKVALENPLYEGQVPYHFLRLLGDARYHRKRYPEAADAYRRALSAKSDLGHGDAIFGLGKALYRKGDTVKALDCYRQALRENASNLETYFRLAQAAEKLGKSDEADAAHAEFRRVARSLPRFAGKRRFRWRLAFLLFPLTRFIV